MINYDFIAKIIDSTVWSLCTIFIVLLMKKPIGKLLNQVTNVKYNNLEIDFLSTIKDIDFNLKSSTNIKSNDVVYYGTIDDTLKMIWIDIEDVLAHIIRNLRISTDYPAYNSSLKNIEILFENNYISSKMRSSLLHIYRLRNKANHHLDFDKDLNYLTSSQLMSIRDRIINELNLITKEDTNE